MSPEPKGNQKKLIKNTKGVYLVDAGAGTGKTFTVSRRYAELLDRGAEPGDILLVTFTENGAENMREEIINHCNYDLGELREAPISTFHGFCQGLLTREGFDAPAYLGIEENITENTRTLANGVQEETEFLNFYSRFRERHEGYENFYRVVYDPTSLLDLIKSLAAKGIFPKEEGWYRSGRSQLTGNYDRYLALLEELNTPQTGKRGKKQSKLLKNLRGMKYKRFADPEIRKKSDIQEGKQVDPEVMRRAFEEDRVELLNFIHDLYHGYATYALRGNYLNYSFQLMFAYVKLMEDDGLRESRQFDYVMVDEFQDTNEIQFKLSLLLSGTGNIAVVGDWKQSIFSFQYAAVENITEFENRLESYHGQINEDRERVSYELGEVEEIKLKKNYRSSQRILDFAGEALEVPGKKGEEVQLDRETDTLIAAKDTRDTEINSFVAEKEVRAVLAKLVEIVESGEYRIGGDEIEYGDVAIFSRNRSFARELDKLAREQNIPVGYEGGAEIFKTDPGLLLLAWLRVLDNDDSRRGWSVILEDAGYNIEEVKYILDESDYPEDLVTFLEKLKSSYDVGEVARTVFDRYGFDNPFTDRIIEVVQDVFSSSYMNLGSLIDFIERNIDNDETYDVDSEKENAATVQTIHSAKGLEYPVVFLANMNSQQFPSTNSSGETIFYDDLIGLRNRKSFSEEAGLTFDNLEAYLASRLTSPDYDEERRLLYVALTRAENYLFLSAEAGRESRFFQELDLEPETLDPDLSKLELESGGTEARELALKEPAGRRPSKRSVHSVVQFEGTEVTGGRGPEFGDIIHEFGEKVARDEGLEPPFKGKGREDKLNLYRFINSLDGELYPEMEVLVPHYHEGKKYVYHGSIDLLNVERERVEVIDYKTDVDRSLQDQYEKQLELYAEAAGSHYSDRKVEAVIFYTREGEKVVI